MVLGDPPSLGLVPAEHREVRDPEEVVPLGLALRHLHPQRAEHSRGHGRLVGHDQDRVARLGAQRGGGPLDLGLGQELGDRRAPSRVLHHGPGQALGAEGLRPLGEGVEATARPLAAGADGADHSARPDGSGEDLELGPAEHLGEVGDLGAQPAVGPVRAVAQHHVVVGEPLHRQVHLDAAEREHGLQHGVHRVVDVLLLHEPHLQVELGELGLAIRAEVLVPEAAGDLVVALGAAHHQQLLEQLRGLRKRVPGARAQAARHQEVARSLRRGPGEDRRLHLQEVLGVQLLPDRAHHVVAQARGCGASPPGAGPGSGSGAGAPRPPARPRRSGTAGSRRRPGRPGRPRPAPPRRWAAPGSRCPPRARSARPRRRSRPRSEARPPRRAPRARPPGRNTS